MLFNEYEKIFHDILGRRTKTMERIVRSCLEEKLGPSQIAKKLKVGQTKDLTDSLTILEDSGFVSRDYYFLPDGTTSKLSQIRVKDNYLRFYLKYVEPNRNRILKWR